MKVQVKRDFFPLNFTPMLKLKKLLSRSRVGKHLELKEKIERE